LDILRPADILLPDIEDYSAWSVVACDQYSSRPEYWDKFYSLVGDKPSTLNMILPEAHLGFKNPEEESVKINNTMRSYLGRNIFKTHENCFIYVERTLSDGNVRQGIVGKFDLEAYDWVKGTDTPIRPTEFTVEDRLPPRVQIRENAPLEMPHIMIFVDDPKNLLFSAVKKGECLYDFELMLDGGHIKGWRIADNSAITDAVTQLSSSDELIKKYGTEKNPIIFAIGDGNHSLAAAKLYWEGVKKNLTEAERENHPARYVLAELVNIHSDAITFEPIHRVLFNTDPKQFIDEAKKHFEAKLGKGKQITLIAAGERRTLQIGGLTLGQLIADCEDFCKAYIKAHGGTIDYIHGDGECTDMASRKDGAGILLPKLNKSELYFSVMKSGAFPKKSFSIGHARDKRYYLECRKIK